MLKHFYREKKGFTLMELVMVIAIIGVLAAIIMPKFSSQRVKADDAATRANLESLRSALALYMSNTAVVAPLDGTSLETVLTTGADPILRAIPDARIAGATNPVDNNFSMTPPTGNMGGWYYNRVSDTQVEIRVNSTAPTASPDDDPATTYFDW